MPTHSVSCEVNEALTGRLQKECAVWVDSAGWTAGSHSVSLCLTIRCLFVSSLCPSSYRCRMLHICVFLLCLQSQRQAEAFLSDKFSLHMNLWACVCCMSVARYCRMAKSTWSYNLPCIRSAFLQATILCHTFFRYPSVSPVECNGAS